MKKEIKFLSIKKLFKDYVVAEKSISLNNSIELLVLIRKIGWRLMEASFPSGKVRISLRITQMVNFGKFLLRMRRHHGDTYVVKYLKSCQLALQKRIAMDSISSLRDLEPDLPLPRLRAHMPGVIPVYDRRSIARDSFNTIRWWLTLFSIYRVIRIPGKLKLSTITDPFSGDWERLGVIQSEIKELSYRFVYFSNCYSQYGEMDELKFPLPKMKLLFPETSSPSSRVSWVSLISDWFKLDQLGLKESLNTVMGPVITPKIRDVIAAITGIGIQVKAERELVDSPFKKDCNYIGQLALKDEPAGKVRVFAMVDVWTQSALRPLHKFLFAFLKSLPNDGTHDQGASVKRCFTKSSKAGLSFGYDLSAATDRLPIALQISVVESLFGTQYAIAWRNLLVGRAYWLKDSGEALHYSVGQPMGALSSWAMLAVTHHLIVQLAAKRVGYNPFVWFDNYELLGDDINIFDAKVASEYLVLMQELGVPINASKSVVAKNPAFEFAKVTGLKGRNVSAISWKMFISQNTLLGRVNILYSLFNKDIGFETPIRYMRTLIHKGVRTPGESRFSYLALLSMFLKSGRYRFEDFFALIMKGANMKDVSYRSLESGVNPRTLEIVINNILIGADPHVVKPVDGLGRHKPWSSMAHYMRLEMEQKVRKFVDSFSPKDGFDLPKKVGYSILKLSLGHFGEEIRVKKNEFLYWGDDSMIEFQTDLWRALVNCLDESNSSILQELADGLPSWFTRPSWLDMKGRSIPQDFDPSFSDWYNLVDLTDRLREVGLLADRALEKVSKPSERPLEKRDNPIKFVTIVAKVYKKRFGRRVNVILSGQRRKTLSSQL